MDYATGNEVQNNNWELTMRIAILSVGDYRHITLISKYTQYFNDNSIDYEIICSDRYGNAPKRNHVFQYRFHDVGRIDKLKSFQQFHNWAKKLINKNQYDFIIVWNENTAFLFADLLLSKYKGKYIVNIRDVDFLNQHLLNLIRSIVIRKSAFSTYCSTAELDFPKNYKYVLMRSINYSILKDVDSRTSLVAKNKPIRIVYIGKVRFFDAIDEIIKAFGNDNRYELFFIGAGSESLDSYLDNYHNLHLFGSYEPEETATLLSYADVINSYFGTSVLGYERMSSIRFAYAPYLHIPVIVGANTNMEMEGNKYGFAYGFGEVQMNEEADAFYNWYHSIDQKKFHDGCNQFCLDVAESDEIFYKKLSSYILSDKT